MYIAIGIDCNTCMYTHNRTEYSRGIRLGGTCIFVHICTVVHVVTLIVVTVAETRAVVIAEVAVVAAA